MPQQMCLCFFLCLLPHLVIRCTWARDTEMYRFMRMHTHTHAHNHTHTHTLDTHACTYKHRYTHAGTHALSFSLSLSFSISLCLSLSLPTPSHPATLLSHLNEEGHSVAAKQETLCHQTLLSHPVCQLFHSNHAGEGGKGRGGTNLR